MDPGVDYCIGLEYAPEYVNKGWQLLIQPGSMGGVFSGLYVLGRGDCGRNGGLIDPLFGGVPERSPSLCSCC